MSKLKKKKKKKKSINDFWVSSSSSFMVEHSGGAGVCGSIAEVQGVGLSMAVLVSGQWSMVVLDQVRER